MPDDLFYTSEHSYAKVENGTVRVGMTDFFAKTAGSIVYVDLPFEGDEVEAGAVCGRIQSLKRSGKLIAPVGGEIIEVNMELSEKSLLINSDPYGSGWLLVIEPSNLHDDLNKLIHGHDAIRRWIDGELKKAEAERAKHTGEKQ